MPLWRICRTSSEALIISVHKIFNYKCTIYFKFIIKCTTNVYI